MADASRGPRIRRTAGPAAWLVSMSAGLAAFAGWAQQPAGGAGEVPKDPYQAYAQGRYDRALEAFAGEQVSRPNDPAVHLNLGSTYYKLEDFEAAEREYNRAARATDDGLRAEALYNLGNAAYRQGRLEEAIARYRATLDLAPEDEDAKYNLEFVQRELEQRREQQQQEQQPAPQEQQQQEQEQQQQRDREQDGEQQQEQQQDSSGQDDSQPRDSEEEGPPDQSERPGEPAEADPEPPAGPGEPPPDPDSAQMTPEQAQRYLRALEEQRPDGKRAQSRVRRLEKDW